MCVTWRPLLTPVGPRWAQSTDDGICCRLQERLPNTRGVTVYRQHGYTAHTCQQSACVASNTHGVHEGVEPASSWSRRFRTISMHHAMVLSAPEPVVLCSSAGRQQTTWPDRSGRLARIRYTARLRLGTPARIRPGFDDRIHGSLASPGISPGGRYCAVILRAEEVEEHGQGQRTQEATGRGSTYGVRGTVASSPAVSLDHSGRHEIPTHAGPEDRRARHDPRARRRPPQLDPTGRFLVDLVACPYPKSPLGDGSPSTAIAVASSAWPRGSRAPRPGHGRTGIAMIRAAHRHPGRHDTVISTCVGLRSAVCNVDRCVRSDLVEPSTPVMQSLVDLVLLASPEHGRWRHLVDTRPWPGFSQGTYGLPQTASVDSRTAGLAWAGATGWRES